MNDELLPRRSNETLFSSETGLRRALHLAGIGLWAYDPEQRVTYWSDETFRILGLEPHPEPVSIDSLKRLIHPDDHGPILHALSDLRADAFNVEYRILRPNGEERLVRSFTNTELTPSEDLLIYGALCDITDLTGAQHQLRERNQRQSEDELSRTKEQLQSIFETLDVSLFSQDMSSPSTLRVSPGTEKIWGIPLEVLLNNPGAWYEVMHPEDIDAVNEKMKELTSGKNVVHDYRIIHPNGEIRWIHDRVTPVIDSTGTLIRLNGVAVDITEIKRTEELLRRSDKLSALGQLAAGIAHEVRNPLTSLKGFIQLIRPMLPDRSDYFDIMLAEVNRINSIISEFLVLAKPHDVHFQPHDLRLIVDQTVSLISSQAILKNVIISVDFSPSVPHIHCDVNQLKQVFINLLKNAVEAMTSGGKITIEASMHDQSQVLIHVIDEGCGISPHLIPKIGEPFYSTKEDGTGLGMMVTYKIIENHRGRMEITSELNRGTTVSILLPTRIPTSPH